MSVGSSSRALLKLIQSHGQVFETGLQLRHLSNQSKVCSKFIFPNRPNPTSISSSCSSGVIHMLERQLQSNVSRGFSTTVFRVSGGSNSANKDDNNQTSTTKDQQDASGSSQSAVSKKDQLVRAVRDYGSTVVVFHVAISLASLGFFYFIVSSGLDVVGLVQKLPYVGAHFYVGRWSQHLCHRIRRPQNICTGANQHHFSNRTIHCPISAIQRNTQSEKVVILGANSELLFFTPN